MPWIYIEVETIPGQENCAITEITPEQFDLINPILLDIQESEGWFPTGDFLFPAVGLTTPFDCYHDWPGWEIFQTILPRPEAGFKKIVRVLLWENNPMTLYM